MAGPIHDAMAWGLLCRTAAEPHRLDSALVLALVMVESGGDPLAIRYEPRYRWLYRPDDMALYVGISADTEKMQQRVSWGLLQVMGAVAREVGCVAQYLTVLTQPTQNLEYGCRHLSWLATQKGYGGDDLIAAWNAGKPSKTKQGKYKNQSYVDKVHRALSLAPR